jgi:hypothetical protein
MSLINEKIILLGRIIIIQILWLLFLLFVVTFSYAEENLLITGIDAVSIVTSYRSTLILDTTAKPISVTENQVNYHFFDSFKKQWWRLSISVFPSLDLSQKLFRNKIMTTEAVPDLQLKLGDECIGWGAKRGGDGRVILHHQNCVFEIDCDGGVPIEETIKFVYQIDSCLSNGVCGVEKGNNVELPSLQLPNLPESVSLGKETKINLENYDISTSRIMIGVNAKLLFYRVGEKYKSFRYFPPKDKKGLETITIPIASPKNVISSITLTFKIQ